MLDIKHIRQEPDQVRALLSVRGDDAATRIDELLRLDEERRARLTELETLKAEQNRIGPEIARAKQAGADATALVEKSTALKARIREAEERVRDLDAAQNALVAALPNLPHASVQPGGEEAALVLRPAKYEPKVFTFAPHAHWDLCRTLGLVDFERGAKLAGAGWVMYTGLGARLERALIALMLDLHRDTHGYQELGLPYALSRESISASGHLVKFAPEMYHDAESDLFFLPTAEPALVNVHRGELFEPDVLPLRYVAHTPCWRREAGAAGRDTRGLLRVHQFDKVEIFRLVLPETANEALEEMTNEACAVLDALDLPSRILKLAGGDMAFAAALTYDVETWAPGVGKWLEVSSASNCTDFQARRADIRFRRAAGAKPEFPHLLNASGLALPRVIAALLETHQQEDGSVVVPVALRPYLGGLARLTPPAASA